MILDTFFVASLYAGMTSYMALSGLKLFAVARPFAYRKHVTLRRCVYALVLRFFLILKPMVNSHNRLFSSFRSGDGLSALSLVLFQGRGNSPPRRGSLLWPQIAKGSEKIKN